MRRHTIRAVVLAAGLTLVPVLAPTSTQASPPSRAGAGASLAAPDRGVGAAADTSAPVRYAALGDSYSSGEGNPPFDRDSGDCHRSSAAWPRMIARQDSDIDLVAHIACSGATSASLRRRHDDEPPQLRQLRNLDQPADLVTITIGGNDIGFGSVLADCFVSDCVLDGVLRRTRQRIKDDLPIALARDYRGLQRADPDANIVVVGYPRLFPSRAHRTGCLWLSEPERRTLNRLARLLDRTIAGSAERAGLEYVSVLGALRQHELCTQDSWVYPIGPFGGSLRGHPIRPGQRAIAAVVRPRLDALL